MLNKITHEIYPKMSKRLEELFGNRIRFERPFVYDGCSMFGGELTGDGKIYSQYDYPLVIDNKIVGRFREIKHMEKPMAAQLQIYDKSILSTKGKGWYVTYYFKSNKTFSDNSNFEFP